MANYLCTGGGAPPCVAPAGMQASRVVGITSSNSIVGSVVLANITFTGVANPVCGTDILILPRDVFDGTLGNPTLFNPLPSNLGIHIHGTQEGTANCVRYSIVDFTNLISNLLHPATISDINSDNIVNSKDLGVMMSKWN